MKKLFTLASIALAICACSSGPEEIDLPSTLTSKVVVFAQEPPTALSCSKDAQMLNFSFNVNSMWTITAEDKDWGFITVTPTRGFEGSQSISISVQQNTGTATRTKVLKITCLDDEGDGAIRRITINQAGIPLPSFTLSPIFTHENAILVHAGDYYDFTVSGVDTVRIGGINPTISFVDSPDSHVESYIGFSTVPGQPNKVRVTNLGIWGGLCWGIQFRRCADNSLTETSYFNLPRAFSMGPAASEASPLTCLPRGIKKASFSFSEENIYDQIELVCEASSAFSLEPVAGNTRSVYLKNDNWIGGKLPIRFKRKSDGALSKVAWITSDDPYHVPFLEVSPGINTSGAHQHDNYYQIGTGGRTLYFNLAMKSIVIGPVKVKLTPWGSDGMFYTNNYTQGYNYYKQKDVSTNPLTPTIDDYGVSYIDNTVKSISVVIGPNMYRYGTITLEYLSETAIINISQQ